MLQKPVPLIPLPLARREPRLRIRPLSAAEAAALRHARCACGRLRRRAHWCAAVGGRLPAEDARAGDPLVELVMPAADPHVLPALRILHALGGRGSVREVHAHAQQVLGVALDRSTLGYQLRRAVRLGHVVPPARDDRGRAVRGGQYVLSAAAAPLFSSG